MGDAARQDILFRHGVDIGDDEAACVQCRKCGRTFASEKAKEQHMNAKHPKRTIVDTGK